MDSAVGSIQVLGRPVKMDRRMRADLGDWQRTTGVDRWELWHIPGRPQGKSMGLA